MRKNNHIFIFSLFSLCIIYILFHIYCFSEISEIFYKAYEVGQLLIGISLSYVAAFIFYLLIDFFPKKERKRKMLENIEIHIFRINSNVNSILKELNYPQNGKTLELNTLTSEKLKTVLQNTPPTFKTKITFSHKSDIEISEYINYCGKNVENEIDELKLHHEIFSPELYKSLIDIYRHNMSKIIPQSIQISRKFHSSINDLSVFESILFKYFEGIKKLNIEWNKNKK